MGKEENREASEQIGTLGGCLIEGDSEQKARERKVKRRALVISIGLQSAALVALVVTPLLAKPEKLSFLITTPMPPYRAIRPHPIAEHPALPRQTPTGFVVPTRIPTGIVIHDDARPQGTMETLDPDLNNSVPVSGLDGGTKIFEGHRGPVAPGSGDQNQKKRISVGGSVQQAMLVHRVEPIYPRLAIQIHKSGQVHLRAVIAADGNIESLQVMDGDPLLIRSALDAVGQWRYRPTLLNGSPVEVETIITVIYSMP